MSDEILKPFTVKQAAAYMQVSKDTIYDIAHRIGRKVGREWRLTKENCDKFINGELDDKWQSRSSSAIKRTPIPSKSKASEECASLLARRTTKKRK